MPLLVAPDDPAETTTPAAAAEETVKEIDVADALVRDLRGPALERAWAECLDAWADADEEERASLAAYAADLRDGAAELLCGITGEDDRRTAAALLYAHLRSEWMLHNVRIGYQVQTGVWDQAAIYQASLLSSVLGVFEDALEPGGEAARVRRLLGRYTAGGAVAAAADFQAAASEPDAEPTFEAGGGDARLRARLHALQVELARHERERRRLGDELGGAPDIETLIRRTRERSARIAELERELGDLRADREALSQATGGRAADAGEAAGQLVRLSGRVAGLEGRVAQLSAERDLMRRELGVAPGEDDDLAGEAVALVGGLRQRVHRLERDLAAVAADRDFLLRECAPVAGRGAPDDLRAAAAYVRDLRDVLAEREAEIGALRDARERLLAELGSADPEEIAAEVLALRRGLARARRSMAGLLGEMDAGTGAPARAASPFPSAPEPVPLPPIPAHLLAPSRRPAATAAAAAAPEEETN